ncbi:MAG: polysaccharide deacetylase family protein [Proteobacteria bacterium]|nr:polysaccharide deacetylase family protein [Pseudomonadota bacterium]
MTLEHALVRGVGAAIAPGGERGRLSVLMYHRVLERHDPLHDFGTPAATFDAQMAALAEVFNVLPLAEAVERMRSGRLPARAVAITFDDGYRDNAELACPILRRHGLSATFFVSSGLLDGGIMFHDAVSEAMQRCAADSIDLAWLGLGVLPLSSAPLRSAAIGKVAARIKPLVSSERCEVTRRIAEQAGVPLPTDLMMSSEQVRGLVAAGMDVGGHTRDHPILTSIGDDEAREQIVGNKRDLEALTGRPLRLFAYPNGKPGKDYAPRHAAMVRDCGYEAAVTTAFGSGGIETDPMQIPRLAPWEMSTRGFVLRLLAHGWRTRDLQTLAAA